jgi:hypothetical protein
MSKLENEVTEVSRECMGLQDKVELSNGFISIENHKHVPNPNMNMLMQMVKNGIVIGAMRVDFCQSCRLLFCSEEGPKII